MIGKVKMYLKKGFLMLLVTAMVCSGSGISALAATTVPADDVATPAAVSDNSTEQPQTEEPEEVETQEVSVTDNIDVEERSFVWEPIEVDHEMEGESSGSTDVEYIYSDGSSSPSGINLNGNSVIIQASANDDSSVSPRKINLILDEDKDGVIDAGEEMVEIDGSTDLIGGTNIYGYYSVIGATEPISITSISGYTPVIFGAYKSSLKTSGETSITMRMLGGEIPGYFYAANESQVISTGAPAVELYVNSETAMTTSQVIAGLESDIQVSGTDQSGIHVEVEKANIGKLYALQSCSYTYKESTAAGVQININGAGVSTLYGIDTGIATADGNETALLDINLKARVYTLYGSNKATLNAGSKTSTAMDMDVTDDGSITSQFYAIAGAGASAETLVTGAVDINISPNEGAESDNFCASTYQNGMIGGYTVVDGDVCIRLNNVYTTSYLYAMVYVHVKGDYKFDITSTCQIKAGQYAMQYSSCDGSVTMNVCGLSSSGSTYSMNGADEPYPNTKTIAGKGFEYNYNGGYAGQIIALDASSSSGVTVGGDVTINVNDGYLQNGFTGINGISTQGNMTVNLGHKKTENTEKKPIFVCYSVNPFANVTVAGDASYTIINSNTSSDYVYMYSSLFNISVAGNMDAYVEGGYYSDLYGYYSGSVGKDVNIEWKDINKDVADNSLQGSFYGTYSGSGVGGKFTTKIDNCKANYIYAVTYESGGVSVGGGVQSTITDVTCRYGLYGACVGSSGGDVRCTIRNSKAQNVTGVKQYYYSSGITYYGAIDGDVDVTMTDIRCTNSLTGINCAGTVTGNVTLTIGDNVIPENEATNILGAVCQGDLTGVDTSYSGLVLGNLEINIYETSVGTENSSSTFRPAEVRQINGTSTLNISNCEIYGNAQLYQVSSSAKNNGEGTISVSATNFHGNSSGTGNFYISPSSGQKVTTTLDSDCSIAEGMDVQPASTRNGESILITQDKTYYGGEIVFDKDFETKNLYLTLGVYHIPEGVTVKAEKLYASNADILLEGTLDATFAETGFSLYMAGGTVTDNLEKLTSVYYPVTLSYKEKGGMVSTYSTYTHAMDKKRVYGMAGLTMTYTVTAKTGYVIDSVTVQEEGSQTAQDAALSGTNTYKFVMPENPVAVDVVFEGTPIIVAKTSADPVLKLNEATTAENPAYDLAELSISNDGEEGAVSYAVDSYYGLPEGLSLVGGKIIGTPTVAYEKGKKTIIRVTGKNDTVAEVPLNIVVTAGDAKQESQEGRIVVNDTEKKIYMSGNSVIIEEAEDGQTALWLDDDGDGVKDYDVAAYTGDLSAYTLYGIYNLDTKNKVRITMNGGNVGTIYGAYGGNITRSGLGLEININAGTVGKLYDLSSAKVTGTMKTIIGETATVTTFTATNSTTAYTGYYYLNAANVAHIYGTYVLRENINVDALHAYNKLVVEENAVVATEQLYRETGSVTILRGTLNAVTDYAKSTAYKGKLIVDGGTVSEAVKLNTYYPITIKKTLEKASVIIHTDSTYVEEEKTYVLGGSSVRFNINEATGYDCYFSMNGAEPTKREVRENYITTPRQPMELVMTYVPKQITLKKIFGDPTGAVKQAYTEEKPLYDFTTIKISNDTTTSYMAGEVKYALKSGNALPAGLSLVNGKIVGTPAKVNKTGDKVTFVITGINGTTATVDMVIKVEEEDYKPADLNGKIHIYAGSSRLNLQGNSVVVLADPEKAALSQIYPDYDHDGIPDSNIPLRSGTTISHDLEEVTLIGYSNTSKPYEGDLSITVKGGCLGGIYGIEGDNKNSVVVNGDVNIRVEHVIMGETTGSIRGLYYGEAENVTVEIVGGRYEFTNFYAAYKSKVNGNADFSFVDDAVIESTNSSNEVYMLGAYNSTIGGDVNIHLGLADTYGFEQTTASRFQGVGGYDEGDRYAYESTVEGDVNVVLDGWFETAATQFISGESVVKGDLNIDWRDGGHLSSSPSLVYDSTLEGDLNCIVEEAAKISAGDLVMLNNATAKNVKVVIPKSVKGFSSTIPFGSLTILKDALSSVENAVYSNYQGNVTIGGTYTIDEDLEETTLTILEDANVTIAEGVSVTMAGKMSVAEGATLTNNGTLVMKVTGSTGSEVAGTFNNYGTFTNNATSASSSYPLNIAATGLIVNHENATWNVASKLANSGKIVNYGEFVQTYKRTSSSDCYRLGTVYTTKKLQLCNTYGTHYSTSYSSVYFPVTLEYPSQCVSSVTLSGDAVSTSGITGDSTQYVQVMQSGSTPTFIVTVTEPLISGMTLDSVTYGPESDPARYTAAQQANELQYAAAAVGVYEPFAITLNYAAAAGASQIKLDKTSDRVDSLVVDNTYTPANPLYDLTTLEITNDMNTEGEETYSVDVNSALPAGLYLKNGKLYGSFSKVTNAEQTIVFIVKGKNQTTASFTLTLGKVAQAVPEWTIPTGFTALVGDTLSDVKLPESNKGTYTWKTPSASVGDKVTTLTDQVLLFTPNDKTNYDWATAAANAGATYSGGMITCNVSVQVYKGIPVPVVPTGLTATYGDTFGDVVIPAGENKGTFQWIYSPAQTVGNVGTHTYVANFIPEDSENYQTVNNIKIQLTVEKAIPTYSKLSSVKAICNVKTLADVQLPDAEGGKYHWVTAAATVPENGVSYEAGFKPDDTENYDWTAVDGWNGAWQSVVFKVPITIEHTYSAYKYDATKHWQTCANNCGTISAKTAHTWDGGKVTTPATTTQTGVKTYTCKCGATKTETIPKVDVKPTPTPAPEFPAVGTTIKDTGSKATYKVSKEGKEVTYVKPDKKTYTSVTIPATVTYEGVKYKVTAIANNACKNNSKLKTVKIGSNVKTIGTKAFYGCTKLTAVTIGSKVTTIGNSAFQSCTALKSITIPKNVSKIGSKAFYGCKKLTKMTIKTSKLTEKKVGKQAFTKMGSSNYKKTTVKVPKKKLKTYKKMLVKCGLSKKAKVKK